MKNLVYFSLISLVFLSCKKDNTDPNPVTPTPGAQFSTPTTVGSYWKYQWYNIDSSGNEVLFNAVDSIYVAGDTVINGNTYTVYRGIHLNNPNYIAIQRDSSGYIVNANGSIQYSYVNFSDYIRYGVEPGNWEWRVKMFDQSSSTVSVPAGNFSTIEAQSEYYDPNGGPVTTCGDQYFYSGSYYANGVGLVKEKSGFYSQLVNCTGHLEARLIEYHIE